MMGPRERTHTARPPASYGRRSILSYQGKK
jgi:hypothetical protein